MQKVGTVAWGGRNGLVEGWKVPACADLLLFDHGFRLDLDEHIGVDEAGDFYHGGGG